MDTPAAFAGALTATANAALNDRSASPPVAQPAITTDIAGHDIATTPFVLLPDGQKELCRTIWQRVAAFYERLAASDFALTD